MHHQYRGETVVATPMASHHHHWGQPLCASNITTVNAGSNKKRDFHFQVISVDQGPKWFVWPSNKSVDQPETNSSKNSSNQENENHYHKNGAISPNTVQPNAPMTINVAHLQRKNRLSRRKQLADMHHHCSVVDGEYAHVTATNSATDAPLSEPLARRLLSKPIICVTPSQESSPSCSSSMPSQTFKILSVSKKSWESEDEDESTTTTTTCSCRKMSLSLDDDCELPSRAHCAAVSGSSISSYISTASSSSSTSANSNDSGVCNGANNNY
uniref:Uncharacterized protein n=1 Tax=Panagrolaimus superbus TaxID=310955 RepID=A0A914Y9G4_9BILA